MRCHYLSDLHLERQEFTGALPEGDCLIVAGDLCNAVCLDPDRRDRYHLEQRDRVLRFADTARRNFRHVLLVPGNHDHYGGIFDDTAALLRNGLPGGTVLDNQTIDIGGVRVFGSTLWSDYGGSNTAAMDRARKGVGEFFFVKWRETQPDGATGLRKFRPEDAAAECATALAALCRAVDDAAGRPLVVVTHHAPSLQGLNPLYRGKGLDGAYASDLDRQIEAMAAIRQWVHGHTHIRRTYRIGSTSVVTNGRGFDGKTRRTATSEATACFDV